MRKILAITIIGVVLAGCNVQKGYNTDQEMYNIAYKMYQEYLFELAIDSTLFMPVIIKGLDDSTRVYRWTAVTPNGDTTGVEVTVAKSREIEPRLIQFGKPEAMILLDNTKHSKKEWLDE